MLHLELPAETRSVPLARRQVSAYCLSDHCSAVPALVDHELGLEQIVALLTTELVANAVLHGGGDVVAVVAECSSAGVWVGCTDANPAAPVRREVDLDATGGRGIALIATLAQEWGCDPVEPVGKRVWFRLGGTPSGPRSSIPAS